MKMHKLGLSAPLFSLVTPGTAYVRPSERAVVLDAVSWPDVVTELRSRFPRLAERVLSDAGGIEPGFVLVVNDEVMAREATYELSEGDQLYLLAAVAGG